MLLLHFPSPQRKNWANKDDQRPPLHSGWYTSTFTFCHFEIGPLSLSPYLWQILHLYFPPLREEDPIFILVEINTLQQTWKLRNKKSGEDSFLFPIVEIVNEFPLGKFSYQFASTWQHLQFSQASNQKNWVVITVDLELLCVGKVFPKMYKDAQRNIFYCQQSPKCCAWIDSWEVF